MLIAYNTVLINFLLSGHSPKDDNHELNNSVLSENNNSLFTSTPNAKAVNGYQREITFNRSKTNFTTPKQDNLSHSKNISKENYLNSVNANTTNSVCNTTTIIADIEGEICKKTRSTFDKSYYIAKEILMTELTYKKDLDVINVVRIIKWLNLNKN